MKTAKNHGQIWLSLMIAVFVLLSISATAWNVNADDKKSEEKEAKAAESRFLIISSHTPEQCLKSLDEYAAKSPDLLKNIDWGCKVGDHTGYVVVKAADEEASRNLLPEESRKKARIVQVDKFTVEQIKAFHQEK